MTIEYTPDLLRQDAESLETVLDMVRWSYSLFNDSDLYYGHGTDNAWDEAVALVLDSLALPSNIDKSLLNGHLTESEKKRLTDRIISRLTQRRPLAYLTNRIRFADIEFYIDERALIPRSPIAELIEQSFQPWLIDSPDHILDLCTGGGCIAMACAIYFPEAMVDAVDISRDALAVAEINRQKHNLSDRVNLIESDVYQAVKGKKYDLIVTNPPYVDSQDMASLPAEYHHEPELALASGEDGLNCTRKILSGAVEHLNPGGLLVLEVGNSAPALEAAYPETSFTWLDFEHGGEGICILEYAQLKMLG